MLYNIILVIRQTSKVRTKSDTAMNSDETSHPRGRSRERRPAEYYDSLCRRSSRSPIMLSILLVIVCLFIYDYSRTTGYEAAYERYQPFQCYEGMKTNVGILLKRLRSRDMA